MTVDEAVAAIGAEFPQADTEQKLRLHSDNCLDITSGGPRLAPDSEPALYVSRELAVAAWQREVLTALRERKPEAIVFSDGPHLDKWHITIMDRSGTQRVAEPRWSVTCVIGLIERAKGI